MFGFGFRFGRGFENDGLRGVPKGPSSSSFLGVPYGILDSKYKP